MWSVRCFLLCRLCWQLTGLLDQPIPRIALTKAAAKNTAISKRTISVITEETPAAASTHSQDAETSPIAFSRDVVVKHVMTTIAAMMALHLRRRLLSSFCIPEMLSVLLSSTAVSNSVIIVQFCFLFLLCRCLIPASRIALPIDSTADMEAMTRARPSRIAGTTSHQGIVIMPATLSTIVPETAPMHRTKRVNEVISRKILRILAIRAILLVSVVSTCSCCDVIACWAFLMIMCAACFLLTHSCMTCIVSYFQE